MRGGRVPDHSLRIGHGYDIHRLQPGGELVLGGVVVSHDISPIAHSDGDVIVHAIVDAICGALGSGDIGAHFPDSDPAHKNAPSLRFLQAMRGQLDAAGFTVVNVDVTVLAERPRLAPYKAQMAANVATILGGVVNIKAGTNEGCDAIGRGEAIAAHAVVLLAKQDEKP